MFYSKGPWTQQCLILASLLGWTAKLWKIIRSTIDKDFRVYSKELGLI